MDYADSFKMYLTTKMPNPHYLPEVCIKVNIINFTVTMEGLEDQLLGQVSGARRLEGTRAAAGGCEQRGDCAFKSGLGFFVFWDRTAATRRGP